ncbi:hypothetical protein BJ138DRAFT_1062170 [Hygrophoropsis aurantiaca]|uniref:Uncharacterized protein n=1 Tax=Hygrophoropsis aurantiaca TaxID=72124 RepID=A0ACB8AFB3_9AGAM|nr:hypothetical protein BJ138DRAFT_1062170 [Hygrophoropsis aurantiaca]
MALVVQMERMRVQEAMAARDSVVYRLENAYISVRQKTEAIDRLERELDEMKRAVTPPNSLSVSAPVAGDECTRGALDEGNPQTCLDRGQLPHHTNLASPGTLIKGMHFHETILRAPTGTFPSVEGPEKCIAARQAILAALPLPPDIPDDALRPIVIPPPNTLHEFLGNASGLTTYWCPDREEHGYFLAPVFKCSTNPRVVTAHQWTAVDVIGRMNKPTECFYNKDGKWYYAGVYIAFRMEDLTAQEWDALSTETSQTLMKETIVGRKNISPQNIYETGQLYAVGALKIACVGLRCVGFSSEMYHAVLEQAGNCARTGKWRTGVRTPSWTVLGDGLELPLFEDRKSPFGTTQDDTENGGNRDGLFV